MGILPACMSVPYSIANAPQRPEEGILCDNCLYSQHGRDWNRHCREFKARMYYVNSSPPYAAGYLNKQLTRTLGFWVFLFGFCFVCFVFVLLRQGLVICFVPGEKQLYINFFVCWYTFIILVLWVRGRRIFMSSRPTKTTQEEPYLNSYAKPQITSGRDDSHL